MDISERLRVLRKEKKLSQGDIEKRTGLLRSYISRVENGHSIPSIETLEKLARALEVPLFQFFYEREETLKLSKPPNYTAGKKYAWGTSIKDRRLLDRFRRIIANTEEDDRKLLLFMARKMARRRAH